MHIYSAHLSEITDTTERNEAMEFGSLDAAESWITSQIDRGFYCASIYVIERTDDGEDAYGPYTRDDEIEQRVYCVLTDTPDRFTLMETIGA